MLLTCYGDHRSKERSRVVLFIALLVTAACSAPTGGEGRDASGGAAGAGAGTTSEPRAGRGQTAVGGAGTSAGGAAGDDQGAGRGGSAGQAGMAGDVSSGGSAGTSLAGNGGFSGTGPSGGSENGGSGGGGSGNGGSGGGSTPLDPALLQNCSGTSPVVCSIPVPNGNHTVTVELGDAAAASRSRVQSELYRISVPETSLALGAFGRAEFSVNVRAERHDGYSASGGVLDLRIDGPTPRLHGLAVVPAPSAITVFVAGDSTVCDWDPAVTTTPDQRGWAQALSQYFVAGVSIANYADSGETAGGFYTKFWPGQGPIRAGDYVFVQFGHNDQKNATDIANYKTNLRKYIADARAKSATPVLFTPVARKSATPQNPGFEGLDAQARELAAEDGVALVDLTTLSMEFFRSQANVNQFFTNGGMDGTHLSETGAVEVSRLVAQAIKNGSLPLKNYVR